MSEPVEAPDDDPRGRRRALAAVLAVSLLALVVAVLVERRSEAPSRPEGAWTLLPHEGLGAWVDAYDWTDALSGGDPTVGLDDIDAMADAGVQTVYLQTAHHRVDVDVLEPERLDALIERAHDRGMHVVAWYLPTFLDLDADLARLTAAAELPVDGLAVDIESVELPDPAERTARLLTLTERLRAAVGPSKVVAAITLSAVQLEVLNPQFWPGYPWAELGRRYDAVLPMAYWSIRTGELRAGGRYIGENLDRVRALVGEDVPIHPIGGIADDVTDEDLAGMVTAIEERGAIGGSLYDWATSTPDQWQALAPLRDLRPTPGA
jgi:hypothetical protein